MTAPRMRARWRRVGWLAAIAGLLLLARYFYAPSLVVGNSMAPTLEHWDLCLMARTRAYQPRRGDIVSFRTADDPPLHFIKRVVALPGETVAIRDGQVLVDDRPLPEPYTTLNRTWNMAPRLLAAGRVFVIGDHRTGPQQDHVYGVVATRLVDAQLLWHWRWKR